MLNDSSRTLTTLGNDVMNVGAVASGPDATLATVGEVWAFS